MPVVFSKRDRDFVGYNPKSPKIRYKEVSRNGEVYDVGGRQVELFKLKVFAEAIDRNAEIVKKWTKKGYIPKPLYQVVGHACLHWYSAEQVVNANRLMMGRWKGKKYLTQPGEFDAFVRDLKEVFYAREVVVDKSGNITREKKE